MVLFCNVADILSTPFNLNIKTTTHLLKLNNTGK